MYLVCACVDIPDARGCVTARTSMDFTKLTIGQLKRELALRNARVSGRNSELVQRLVANLYS